MRKIKELVRKHKKTSSADKEYILYTYRLDDGSEVDTLQEFEVGERVEVWLDEKWDKAKLKKKGKKR